jgi:hypothetical protein
MVTKGAFGYIIGKKKRLMLINDDADLLWQILVREIYVLMNHYKTKEELQLAFKKIEVAKNKPKQTQIEKCKCFADFERNELEEWDCLLQHCQSSFINILEAGYILNEKNELNGHIFVLDFNKGEVNYYYQDIEGKQNKIDSATIEEILLFDDMPTKSYTEIVSEMNNRFIIYFDSITKVQCELEKLNKLLIESKRQGAANIEDKVDKLIYDMKMEQRKIHTGRRVFYNRLKVLDLIEESTSTFF